MENTKKLAVIGNPIEHSFSPRLHNYISKKMGLNYQYEAILVEKENFTKTIDKLIEDGYVGINITSPFKIDAYNYADVLSDEARENGSVNTYCFRDGKIFGYTTDAKGLFASILYNGVKLENKDILFIGAGGATIPAAVHFSKIGAKSISIHNRTQEKSQNIADYINKLNGYKIDVGITREHYDVVINTTTVGMHPNPDATPITDISFIDENTFVYDMIYNPKKTKFLELAEEKGAKVSNGLGMLIYQGIFAYEKFTGVILPDTIYDDIMADVFCDY